MDGVSKKPYAVDGEASESDSEEELNQTPKNTSPLKPISGKIIHGEAHESDDESSSKVQSLDSISTAVSVTSIADDVNLKTREITSLLGKKLYERNKYLYKDINDVFGNMLENAKDLNTVDQHLLRCQMKLQTTVDIVDALQKNIGRLEDKLQGLMGSAYFSDIKYEINT